MKRIAAFVFGTAVALSALAVPAKPGLKVMARDAAGNLIEVTRAGDEYFHYYINADGTPMEELSDGTLRAVSPEVLNEHREAALQLRLSPLTDLSPADSQQAPSRAVPAATIASHNKSTFPRTGSPRIPVLLVEYKDVHFKNATTARADFQTFFSGEDNEKSVQKYFSDNSNGHYVPQFDVYGPVRLPQNRSYYGANSSTRHDQRLGTMVAETCNLLNNEVDFSIYDNDGDGECDAVIVMYAGVGEAQAATSTPDAVWPCQWKLASSNYGNTLTLDNTTINTFAVFNELNGTGTAIDGIGTVCHEFSHVLGLPDFYSTSGTAEVYGMGYFSLMHSGCYLDDGYTPCGYSAYEKCFMGWLDELPEPTPNTWLKIPAINNGGENELAYKIVSNKNPNEYYIIETRTNQGWDEYLYDAGLMIYHVDYSAFSWSMNNVNNSTIERMALVCGDNTRNFTSPFGDLFPNGVRNKLTDDSDPAMLTNSGEPMGKPLTNIGFNRSKKTVDVKYMDGYIDSAIGDVEADSENAPAEYFDLSGRRVADPTPGIYIRRQGSKVKKVAVH